MNIGNNSIIIDDNTGNINSNGGIRSNNIRWETFPINLYNDENNINDTIYSKRVYSRDARVITGARVLCTFANSDPTNLKAALYDLAGTTRLANTTGTVLAEFGIVNIPFDSPYTVAGNLEYWISIGGDASNSNFANMQTGDAAPDADFVLRDGTTGTPGASLSGSADSRIIYVELY